ncbi:hypothetical protein Zmor_009642 [Zophobas morio]|uniref:Uncharacterized protein n=1 Tax=Zophobas morio TaxID=2755281 RepID=A0AA38IPF5_9CUCU|nr:hypothetical protein Zmor_009642 [Zophobas morio]
MDKLFVLAPSFPTLRGVDAPRVERVPPTRGAWQAARRELTRTGRCGAAGRSASAGNAAPAKPKPKTNAEKGRRNCRNRRKRKDAPAQTSAPQDALRRPILFLYSRTRVFKRCESTRGVGSDSVLLEGGFTWTRGSALAHRWCCLPLDTGRR